MTNAQLVHLLPIESSLLNHVFGGCNCFCSISTNTALYTCSNKVGTVDCTEGQVYGVCISAPTFSLTWLGDKYDSTTCYTNCKNAVTIQNSMIKAMTNGCGEPLVATLSDSSCAV